MSIDIPNKLRSALRDYQRDAIGKMKRYIATFNSNHPQAGLVLMPTGSGKTGVIATLGRCETRQGLVLVIAPRIGVREQLARHIDRRFFEHAQVDRASLRRMVVELEDGGQDPGPLEQLVVVTTVQLLASIQKKNVKLWEKLRKSSVLVMFDEGHYEPATVWSQVVRNFSCPRIIFTATAFRDDFKTFDIDPNHIFRYSFHQARHERYVRDVRFHPYAPVQSPIDFADQVLEAYDRFFHASEDRSNRPRVIIRCDKPEEIRQISAAIRQRARSVIGIHETFSDNLGAGEYHKVPTPDQVDATFWVHQFKLLEGIDDSRFQMLALFGELRSVRSFVQQVGRIIRNPTRVKGATAHVLDHSKRARQTALWNEFLEYDKLLEKGDSVACDVNQQSLVQSLQQAVRGLLYIDGRFRAPADISELGLDDLQMPLSANIFLKPVSISLDRIKSLIVRQCQDQNLLFHAPDPTADTVIVFHIRIGASPILEKVFFPEPKLGVSLVHVRGKYAFVYDSSPTLGASAVGGRPIDGSQLSNLFGRKSSGKLTQVSMHNSNLGADQVRTRAMTAVSVDQLVPTFDEHGYVLTTATGYSRGRRGDANGPETQVRRYIGIGSGRISDFGGGLVPFDVWINWISEVQHVLDGKTLPLRVFSRWAGLAGWPPNPVPRNVLIDLSEVLDRYRTTAGDDLPEGEELEVSGLCADVQNGRFSIETNGRSSEIEILARPDEGKYVLRSADLDTRYYSIDPENREGIIHYLNRTQSFRVIPATPAYFYTVGQFCRPLIQFGPEYDDSKMGVLGALHATPSLRNINSEKGDRSRRNQAGWERGSLFDLIDDMGAGTDLAQEFGGTVVLVCDDLGDESADFILVQDETQHHGRRVVFIHAKAKRQASKCSASALQDVCGQAQKNLREVSLFAEAGPSKRNKWSRPWDGPHTQGRVAERIRKRNRDSDPEDDIRRTVKDPNADREIWLLLGNLLSKQALKGLLLGNSPPGYAIQAAYLLFSTITNAAAAGARLRVFCGP